MSDPIPLLLACAAGPLLPLAVAAAWADRYPAIPLVTTLMAGLVAVLALIWLPLSAEPAGWTLSPGVAGLGLGLDVSNGPTLIVVTVLGAFVITHLARATPRLLGPPLAAFAVAIPAGMATTQAARAVGFVAIGLALAWGAERRREARGIVTLTCWVGLTSALAAWSQPGWSPALLALCGPFLALALPPRLPPRLAAMASATLVPLAGMELIRLAQSAETAQPVIVWLYIAAGAAVGLYRVWAAGAAADLGGLTRSLLAALAALTPIAAGLAVQARAADLPESSAAALTAAFTLVIAQSLGGTLMFLAADTVATRAGTLRAHALGGLWRLMPLTAVAWLTGLLTVLAIPPGLGFAAGWWFWRALMAAPRGGAVPAIERTAIAATVLGVGCLGLMAGLRGFAVAFLGRPRHPRGAGATDPDDRLAPLTALLCLTGILSLFPGLLVALTRPALRAWTEGTPPIEPVWFGLATAEIYVPALIALFAVGGAILAPRLVVRGADHPAPPPWQGGHGPIPRWMPHGDAPTQTDGSGFSPAALGGRWRVPSLPPAWWAMGRATAERLLPWLPAAVLGALLLPRLAAAP